MAIKGLKKKITCVVVVPCILGLILSWLSSAGYIYLTYPKLMNDYTDKMVSNQKETLLKESTLLGQCSSLSYVQKILNLVNTGSDFIESYLFYGMIVNTDLNTSKIYESYKSKLESKDLGPEASVWYYKNLNNTKDLSTEASQALRDSSYYDSIISPATKIAYILRSMYKITYISFNSGLIYSNPAQNTSFDSISTCPSYSGACDCDAKSNVSYYDPRCRGFYNQVYDEKSSNSILTDPYFFTDGTRGLSACRGIWNYTTSTMLLTFCVDFQMINFFEISLVDVERNDVSYSFVLNTEESVLTYRDYHQTKLDNKTITELEFNDGDHSSKVKKQIRAFRSKILPLFTNQTSKVTYYSKYDHRMMIAVSPIMMQMSSDGTYLHVASVGVVMKKSHIESKFNSLKSKCNDILTINLIIQLVLLLLILVFCIVVTHKLSGQIIEPVDHLLKILNRLKADDLSIDILNSYQPSPPEVSCLYNVFDELRVVLRFTKIDKEKLTEATLIYSQALKLFKKFGNERALEICYRELGYICYKKKMWDQSGKYLHKALTLAIKLGVYDEYEISRIKTDAATALVKTGEKRVEGLKIFKEALDTFNKGCFYTDIVIAMIEIAESLVGTSELSLSFLDYIEQNLENTGNEEKDLLYQKFLYIKAGYFKSIGKYKSAVSLIQRVLEDFSKFLPEIWIKSLDLLIEILSLLKIDPKTFLQMKQQRKVLKKDLVLVISDSLIPSPISHATLMLLGSVLDPADRISILQFADEPLTIYTLSKTPVRNISLDRKMKECSEPRLFDCIQEGIKQLRITNYPAKEERKSWVIIITDSEDKGSKTTLQEVVESMNNSNADLILIRCFTPGPIFEGSSFKGKNFNEFFVSTENNASLIFKEIEVFLCPFKEVFL